LIPVNLVEVIIGLAPDIEKSLPGKPNVTGWNDWPCSLVNTGS
jgi:hypothetical protein